MTTRKLTFKNAILAQCHECLGWYIDGKVSCQNKKCSLFSFMPYREKDEEPDLTWLQYNPRSVGKKLLTETRVGTGRHNNGVIAMQKARETKKENSK